MTERSRIFAGLAAEVSFAILPLLVVLMVLVYLQHASRFFASPEWSFGASILFGQTLVKFVSNLAKGGEAARGPVALVVALLVVFGLVPSLFLLNWSVQATESPVPPRAWLQVGQVVLFFGASAVYMVFGTISETWKK